MGLSELDRVDLVAERPGGGEVWIIVADDGWPADLEAMRIVQFLVKLATYERHARRQKPRARIEVYSAGEPPAGVVALLAKKQITAWTATAEARHPSIGRPDGYPAATWPDLAALQAANARSFARAHGLPEPPALDALDRLDEVLAARRRDAGLGEREVDADDRAADGDLIVLAGAYAGEAIRAAIGGAWTFDPSAEQMQPLHLLAGPSPGYTINVVGKVKKYLSVGAGESLRALATTIVDMAPRKV
jgi:hypothetical protein